MENQTEFLNRVEDQLEAQLKEVIAVFQNLPEEILLKPASNNGWSIAQCFAHLNTYAEFYHPRIAAALRSAPPAEASEMFKHSFLGRYFISSMDPDRAKKKYKAMKKHRPGDVSDPHRVVSTFIQHLENLFVLLKEARRKNLKKKLVSTSLSPLFKISTGDAIAFVLTHNRRHLLQAKHNITK